MSRLIITGATGFLGRNLAEAFHERGHEVVATGRSLEVGRELSDQGMTFIPADIVDYRQLESVFCAADCVVHCAALAGPWGRYGEFYQANVVGTRQVLRACQRHNIDRIVFVSTPSVYYDGTDRYDICESDPLPARQLTHYGATKLIAEERLREAAKEGIKTIILRPRAIIGPHDNTIIPRILRLADKKRMPLVGGGEAFTDITYVDNMVHAVSQCLGADDAAWNETYNISNGDPIRVKDWFAQVLEIFGKPFVPKNVPEPVAKALATVMEAVGYLPFVDKEPPLTRFSVGYMATSMTMSVEKAAHKLGYAPPVTNRQGFERYAAWHRSQSCAGA